MRGLTHCRVRRGTRFVRAAILLALIAAGLGWPAQAAPEPPQLQVTADTGIDNRLPDRQQVAAARMASGSVQKPAPLDPLASQGRRLLDRPEQKPAGPEGTSTLAVTVRDENGVAAENAHVQLFSSGGVEEGAGGYTNASGQVTLSNLNNGTYTLTAALWGRFVLAGAGVSVTGSNAAQLSAQGAPQVTIRTFDVSNNPVEAAVQAWIYPSMAGDLSSSGSGGQMVVRMSSGFSYYFSAHSSDGRYYLYTNPTAVNGNTTVDLRPASAVSGQRIWSWTGGFNAAWVFAFPSIHSWSYAAYVPNSATFRYSPSTYSFWTVLQKSDGCRTWEYWADQSGVAVAAGSSGTLYAGGNFTPVAETDQSVYAPGATMDISTGLYDAYGHFIFSVDDGYQNVTPRIDIYDPGGEWVTTIDASYIGEQISYTLSPDASSGTYMVRVAYETGPHQGTLYATAYPSINSASACYTLTLNSAAGGTVYSHPAPNCLAGGVPGYTADMQVRVLARAAAGYQFDQWVDRGITNPSLLVTMDGSGGFTPSFKSCPGCGAISVAVYDHPNSYDVGYYPSFPWGFVPGVFADRWFEEIRSLTLDPQNRFVATRVVDLSNLNAYQRLVLPGVGVRCADIALVDSWFTSNRRIIAVDSAAAFAAFSGYLWPAAYAGNGMGTVWDSGSGFGDQRILRSHKITTGYTVGQVIDAAGGDAEVLPGQLPADAVALTGRDGNSSYGYVVERPVPGHGTLDLLGPFLPLYSSQDALFRNAVEGTTGGGPGPGTNLTRLPAVFKAPAVVPWSRLTSFPTGTGPVLAIYAGNQAILVGTRQGGLYRSADNGGIWSRRSQAAEIRSIVADPVRPGAYYAASYAEGVFKSSDNGNSWVSAKEGLQSAAVYDLAANAGQLFAGTDVNGAYISEDAAAHWRGLAGVDDNQIFSVQSGAAAGTVYAGMINRGVYRTINSGQSWQQLHGQFMPDQGVRDILEVDGTIFAASQAAGLWRSPDNGASWSKTGVPGDGNCLLQAGSTLYAGSGSGLYKSVDNGISWTPDGLAGIPIYSLGWNGVNLFAGTEGAIWRR